MSKSKLTSFQLWMVTQNIQHATTEGLDVVLARLRAGGYNAVADAVELAFAETDGGVQ